MRTLLSALLIIFCASIFISCKKEETTNAALLSLVGKWELRKQIGGVGGLNNTYLPGNGNTIEATKDSLVLTWTPWSDTLTYSIVDDPAQTDPTYFLLYLNTSEHKLHFFEKDRFVFWLENPDTYYNTYERIQ